MAAASCRGVGSPRLVFIDNLRWSAISMVVVIHAAVTYSGLGSWYVHDLSGTGRTLTICLGTYQSFQHSVAMGLLFGIAGYFARAAVERKGAAGFLPERAFRLGLPLLLYMLVVGPVTPASWASPDPSCSSASSHGGRRGCARSSEPMSGGRRLISKT